MKYGKLIDFHPIEDVIQLKSADDVATGRGYVESYVVSDTMADNLVNAMINQLQLDEVVDNKGVLVVGNYGTGKSHLMSVVSAIASAKENLPLLKNKKLAASMESIAGRFEILRIEIGGVTMSLREILLGFIEDDFKARGIEFTVPDLDKVRDNKKLIKDVMLAFAGKYPDKGYLIVVDEFLSYLTSRNTQQIVLDLEFLRALGEMCSKSKIRIILGVQEKIFDNPRFSFVSDTLKHVSDRFSQVIITKEATSFVVSERILKKTAEQKALIREHLEKFSNLYEGMASRMDDFVELYPIHPAYIDVFNKIYIIENRHILKNISLAIKNVFDTEVPENAPGIISFDDYWPAIKSNGLLKSDATISRVVTASSQLEDIIDRSFPKPAYKELAIKMIYALSVHRLTTNGLDVHFGLTAENMKDDLCLHLDMPEEDSDFLLGIVKTTLKDIMATVSGQFIIFNDANNQYYIDVDKVVDYDEKIKQRATILTDDDLNRYFYQLVYGALEWEKKQYVQGFEIYERDINWASHNIFREGYLFMGIPGERSTAQPERDFYIHIMPPYGKKAVGGNNLPDEVYFYFKSSAEFKDTLSLFAAANLLTGMSDGKDKDAYKTKAEGYRKKLIRCLGEQKNTAFEVMYKKNKQRLIDVVKGHYRSDDTFGDTVDMAASLCLDDEFDVKYPNFPVMKTKVTRENMIELTRAAYEHFAGRKTQQSAQMLMSFGILDGDKIRPEGSMYAAYYINMVKKLSPQGVINYDDIFEPEIGGIRLDKKFHIPFMFTPIIFLAMVYGGYAVITLENGETVTAATLDRLYKISPSDLFEFKYLSRPAQMSMAELKHIFEVVGLNPAILNNPNERDKAVEVLLKMAQELCNIAVRSESKLVGQFYLWGESLTSEKLLQEMKTACFKIKDEFGNYHARFNTPAKLNNFALSMEEIDDIAGHITALRLIEQYESFKTNCSGIVEYVTGIEAQDIDDGLCSEISAAKDKFRTARDSVADGTLGETAASEAVRALTPIKDKYIDLYFAAHKKKRLGQKDAKKRGEVQESLAMSNLRKLKVIDILSAAKFSAIEAELALIKICYDLTPEELKHSPTCHHCGYRMGEKGGSVQGKLEQIETQLQELLTEWGATLINTISDPLVKSQEKFLSTEQAKVIEDFLAANKLPEEVDEFFVRSIQAILKNYEPVIIDADKLLANLEQLPPMDEKSFKDKLSEMVSVYTKGKDAATLRIVVKRSRD